MIKKLNNYNKGLRRVKSIEELKKICQKKVRHDWGLLVNNFYRPLSFYFVKLLLYTNISANQVTLISITIGVCASVLFLFRNVWVSFVGALFLFLWYIGECCDGSIARYRNVVEGKPLTKLGRYIDWANVRIVTNALFICITIRSYNYTKNMALLFICLYIIVIFFMVNTIPGSLQFAKTKKKGVLGSTLRTYVKIVNLFDKRTNPGESVKIYKSAKEIKSKIQKVHYYLYSFIRVCWFPFFFTFAAILNIVTKYLNLQVSLLGIRVDWILLTYLFLGGICTVVWFFEISSQKI